MLQPPEYFEAVRQNAARRWKQWSEDPELGGPVHQLFKQVRDPRHVVSELLQNADDAGATKASAQILDSEFVFQHNGEDFTPEQFASLCRFAYSNKRTWSTTGFRGIGFKSTFSLGPEVRIVTPTLAVKFFRDRFTEPVWMEDCSGPSGITEIRVSLAPEGVHVELLASLHRWAASPTSLLFCKHVRELCIMDETLRWIPAGTPRGAEFDRWQLTTRAPQTAIRLRSAVTRFPADALSELKEERRFIEMCQDDEIACPVELVVGVRSGIYAVLPTEEKTSLPFACNGPFMQPPDRVGVIPPERSPTNRWLLQRIGQLAGEGMIAWLGLSDLEVRERCEAYRVMPDIKSALGPTEDHCLSVVAEGFRSAVHGRRVLLSENGNLLPSHSCIAVPRELLEIWPYDVVESIASRERMPILSRWVTSETVDKLQRWKWVSVKSKRDILDLLAARATVPRPASLHKLLSFWEYVSEDVTHSHAFRNYQKIPIVPVRGRGDLLSSDLVVRPADDWWGLSRDDFAFLASFVPMLDDEWVSYLTESRETAKRDINEQLAGAVKQAENVLREIDLHRTTDIRRVLERVVRQVPEATDATDWIRLARITAKLDIPVCQGFLFLTRDDQLRPSETVIADCANDLSALTAPEWYRQHALHESYHSTLDSNASEAWERWVKSGRSGLVSFLPIREVKEMSKSNEQLERELRERGVPWKAQSGTKSSFFTLYDWDVDQDHWDYWDSIALRDKTIWLRFVSYVLHQTSSRWLGSLCACLKSLDRGKTSLVLDQIPAKWICRLRERRCLRDSLGELRYPRELLRSTASTEFLFGTGQFVHPELSSEEAWPLLKALGVKEEPPGPLELIPFLRDLSHNAKYDSGDVERIYQQLSSMTETSTEDDARKLCDVFAAERLIRTENGTWARSCDVMLEDDASRDDVLIVWQKVRYLGLWRRLNIPARSSPERNLAWLQDLPSHSRIDARDVDRIIRILSHDPEQAWKRCGHWISESDEWVPWDQLKFGMWSTGRAPYRLFPNRMRQVANLGFLGNEYRAKAPFSDLVPLEDAIEERATESDVVRREGEPKGWLMALGSGLSRVKLKDAEETKRIRELGERLAVTQVVVRPTLKVLPYLGGELAGEPRDSDVLWSGEVLYVRSRPSAQMAKTISEELGRFFRCSDIGDAIKYCYEREEQFVNDYLNATFQLESPTTVQKSSTPRGNTAPAERNTSLVSGRGKTSHVGDSQREKSAITDRSAPERQTEVGTTDGVPGQAASARSDTPAVSKPHTAGSSIPRPGGSRSGSPGASGSTGTSPRSGYEVLRSYVVPDSRVGEVTESNDNTRRNELGQIGVERVLEFEKRAGRFPEEMPPLNAGFDVRSSNAAGAVKRYIEVKSLSGDWNGVDVAITRAQFEFALQRGPSVWLYVVERAAQDDFRVYPIQNPAQQANRFMFDYGWKDLAEPPSMGVPRRDDLHMPSTTGLEGDSGRAFQLADLLTTLPDQTSVAIWFEEEERFNGCNENGVAWFQFLQDTDPLPERGAIVIVRHPELRRGSASVPIAAGKFFWSRQRDGDTGEQYVLVKLQGSAFPAKCQIPAEEWDGFRPLLVLRRTEGD